MGGSRLPRGERHGKRELIAERRSLIWELIRSGVTDVRGLSAALAQRGITASKTTVHKDITITLGEYRKQRLRDTSMVVDTEVAQLDQYEQALALKIKGGDSRAVVAAVRVKERRARLLGLDAPDQWQHEAEMRRMVTREQMLLYMRALTAVVLDAIEAHIPDEDTRTTLRTTIAHRFAIVSGGRSSQNDPSGDSTALVVDANAEHPSSAD